MRPLSLLVSMLDIDKRSQHFLVEPETTQNLFKMADQDTIRIQALLLSLAKHAHAFIH